MSRATWVEKRQWKPAQIRASETSSTKACTFFQRWTTPGAVGLVIVTSGNSAVPNTVCTTPARAGAFDAVRTRVLWMHRRRGERLPDSVALGGRVAIDVTVANGGDGPPKFVMVLGIEHRNQGIGPSGCHKCKQAGGIDDVQPLCTSNLSDERVKDSSVNRQPEEGILALPCRAFAAGAAAEFLHLVVICGPIQAVKRDRRRGAELGRARQSEWLYPGPLRYCRGRGRHIDSGCGARTVGVRCFRAVVCPRLPVFSTQQRRPA